MPEMFEIKAKIISQKGTCSAGHKVGDEFIINEFVPAGMCCWAFNSLFPFVAGLKAGGSFPWEKETDIATVPCPDDKNPVIFELRRIKK